MTKYQITIKGVVYDVEILDDPRKDEVRVIVNGEEFTVEASEGDKVPVAVPSPVRASTPVAAQATGAGSAAAPAAVGPGTIKAPLPGVINSIKVHAGQQVKPNDEICVIEAMKAMNVIRAPREGKITRIHVSVGGSVAYGSPLMDIE